MWKAARAIGFLLVAGAAFSLEQRVSLDWSVGRDLSILAENLSPADRLELGRTIGPVPKGIHYSPVPSRVFRTTRPGRARFVAVMLESPMGNSRWVDRLHPLV